jgi:hypothetical protein
MQAIERIITAHMQSLISTAKSSTETDPFRVDRTALSIATHESAAAEDRIFWKTASIEARWQAVEHQRMIAYGYTTPPRFQRILEIA